MEKYTIKISQRSRYNTAKGDAHFLISIPEIYKIIQDGRFLSIYYKSGTKDKLEFNGSYDEAKEKASKKMEDINILMNKFLHELYLK